MQANDRLFSMARPTPGLRAHNFCLWQPIDSLTPTYEVRIHDG